MTTAQVPATAMMVEMMVMMAAARGEVFDMYDPEMNARACYVLTLHVFGVHDDAD